MYLGSFTVVRLSLSEATGVGPVTGVTLGSGTDFGARSRPEPAVDVWWLKVGAVAASEVTFASRRPDEPDVTTGYPLLYELIFLK